MAYTCGAGTGDDISISSGVTLGADNGSCLVAGWWYPTTLTATRGYWSAGSIFGAEIDTTTSEIRMRTDNTTDGQWLTSGAGITTNKWWFLAFLNASENTTVAGQWRVWVGDAETSPAEKTVTNPTARSGNYTGSSAVVMGNKGTGSLAFQGDLGWMSLITTNTAGKTGPLGVNTSGVIDTWETDFVLRRWVQPLWLGRPPANAVRGATFAATWSIVHLGLDTLGGTNVRQDSSASSVRGTPTVNGCTWTNNEPPVRINSNWPVSTNWLRRR